MGLLLCVEVAAQGPGCYDIVPFGAAAGILQAQRKDWGSCSIVDYGVAGGPWEIAVRGTLAVGRDVSGSRAKGQDRVVVEDVEWGNSDEVDLRMRCLAGRYLL